MTAPVANKITLPSDTGNSGKNVRTITKTIGADSVHSQFWVPDLAMTLAGKYFFATAQQSVSATAHDGLATAFMWLQLPTAATVTALLRRIRIDFNGSAATAMPTAPVISFTKFTFTGTASGAQSATPNAIMTHATAGSAPQITARTAVTGMTPALVNTIGSVSVPAILTAVGIYGGGIEVLPQDPFAWQRGHSLELAPGEGIVMWQSVAGTTSDIRKFTAQFEWLELDLT
jgi:hypothetical protein